MKAKPKILGQLLVEAGAVDARLVEAALKEQDRTGVRLGEILLRRNWAGPEAVARALAVQLSLPYEGPPLTPTPEALALVQPRLARSRQVLPLRLDDRTLRVVAADPLLPGLVDDLRFQSGHRVELAVAPARTVTEAIELHYGETIVDLLHRIGPESEEESGNVSILEAEAGAAPVVQVVEHLIREGIDRGASDIHLEQGEGHVQVRYRIDGVLRGASTLPARVRRAVLSRLKIMAGMDISVRRRPQDGGFTVRHEGRLLAIRASTLPVRGGEKAVLRILDPEDAPQNLGSLGLSGEDLRRLRTLLQGRQGVVLAAGPTGSGKSSTLFGALGEVERDQLNVITLEDPLEYRLQGVNQVEIRPRAGLTFPSALRSVLRQDPDVIMVGEIRDGETAEIAMSAAVTGHLVLSTIHTVDAPTAIVRLLDMGVPPHLVAGGLAGVVAQRLVRRLCVHCKGRSEGECDRCPDGYRGRTGLFQVLVVSDSLREAIARGAGIHEMRILAHRTGMGTLGDDGRRKVAEGVTTPHELGRALQGDLSTALPCQHCGRDTPVDGTGCPHCGLPRSNRCSCGRDLASSWRFCPDCLRRA